jgi:hypothetical protein
VRYGGERPPEPVAALCKTEDAVFYKALRPIEGVFSVGMTIEDVRQRLKLDFSPASGILFPYYTRNTYLHVGFANGRVSGIRTGDNSVCYERWRK